LVAFSLNCCTVLYCTCNRTKASLPLRDRKHLLTWNSLCGPRETNIADWYRLQSFTMASENPSMKLDPNYDNYDYPTTSPNSQSGHPGHTTPEQDAQVYQLRMKLEADGYTERLDTLTLVRGQSSILFPQILLTRGLATISTSPKVRCGTFRENVRCPNFQSTA